MRSTLVLLTLIGLAATACGPKTFTVNKASYKVVALHEMIKKPDAYAKIFKRRERVIIKIRKGQTLPMHFVLDTKVVTSKGTQTLVVQRDMCVLISKTQVALSPDCKTFASMKDGKSVAKLFGLKGGKTSVGLSVNKTGVHLPVKIVSK